MNAIMNKTNNGKLLAAIVAMAMIVCAVAVIATPLNATPGDSTEPYDLDDVAVTVTDASGEESTLMWPLAQTHTIPPTR